MLIRPSERPWSDRLCDWVTVGFAVWTVCCHLTVAAGGSLIDLLKVVGIAAIGLIGFRLAMTRRTAIATGATEAHEPHEPHEPRTSDARRFRITCVVGLVAGSIAVGAYLWSRNPLVLWWLSVGCLAIGSVAALFFVRSGGSDSVPASTGRPAEPALWALAVVCVAVTLIANRPDADDCFYINVAVTVADAPDAPLLERCSLFGDPAVDYVQSFYRPQSWEVLNGAVACVTGIPALSCFHIIGAAFAALLAPLALARLFRLLTPRHWLWCVVAVIVVLIGLAPEHRWYGNFAFVRLWQGKSIYLTVFVPLAYAYGIEFGQRPTWRRWILLAAVQIASVGLTSSAIWSVPIACGLGVLCAIRTPRHGLAVLAAAAASSTYVIIVGLRLKSHIGGLPVPLPHPPPLPLPPATPGVPTVPGPPPEMTGPPAGFVFDDTFVTVLGTGFTLVLGVAALVFAWTTCRRTLATRFTAWVPAIVLLLVLNPYFETLIARHLTGISWRGVWALPLPILMGLLLTAPVRLTTTARGRLVGRLATILAIAALAMAAPRWGTLSPGNHTELSTPGPKADRAHLEWAKRLRASVPPGAIVVAPTSIAVWLPMLHEHPYPVVCRYMYAPRLRFVRSAQEANHKIMMTVAVSGEDDFGWHETSAMRFRSNRRTLHRLRDGLAAYDVQAVCLSPSAVFVNEIRAALLEFGYERRDGPPGYEIWIRE